MIVHGRKFYVPSLLLLVTVLLAACQIGPGEYGAAKAETMATSRVNVHLFSDSEVAIDGATSALNRRADGIDLVLNTTGLTPGDAYTVWWLIFNNPADCADIPCSSADLSNPRTMGMVAYATGGIANEQGEGHFVATLAVGDTSNALDNGDGFPLELIETTLGLVDPQRAEIHAVIRTHGAAHPDPIEQLTTFGGGCNPACANVQAAFHSPQALAQN